MDDDGLTSALERAEFALRRIERSLERRDSGPPSPAPDQELRAKVREVVAELDQWIREAGH